MTEEDIETVRAAYRESYHRKTAARRAKGLCVKCGQRSPEPGRTRCEPCAGKQRAADLERYHRRTAERVAAGMCPKCGKRPPAPGRSQCQPCLEKDAAAGRARDARLRGAGVPRRDPAREREYRREHNRCEREQRSALGLCIRCGKSSAAPGRMSCEPCLDKRRASDRAKYAAGKAAGMLYGGSDPEVRRRVGRKRSRKRSEDRRAAGLCVRCGAVPPAEGRTMCEPCRDDRRAADRARHAERRAAGVCPDCAAPAPGGKLYCEPCAGTRSRRRNLEAKRKAARRRYAERRARGDCTSCGKPTDGTAECQSCRDAARDRYDARRAAMVCVKCRAPTVGGAAYCAPCAAVKAEQRDREAQYAARRRRYAERRAKGLCVGCGAPSPGVARCEPCSRKHRESSGAFRGIPLWDPSWTVIEIATGEHLGTYDSEMEVAACLAFARLSHDEVEVIADVSPMASLTAPRW